MLGPLQKQKLLTDWKWSVERGIQNDTQGLYLVSQVHDGTLSPDRRRAI